MANLLHNLDPKMVACMRTHSNEESTVPLEATDSKTDQAGQVILTSQTDPSRCWSCKRRVGLLGFKCRCKNTYCSKHRHASEHECTFDYLTANKQQLAKQLTPCVADKVTNRI